MPGTSHRGPLAPLTEREDHLATALRADVTALVHDGRTRSPLDPAALAHARDVIDTSLTHAGYAMARLPFDVDGATVTNLEATLPGTTNEIVLVGAHYDTAANPGADDNASGVAVLLAVARAFAGTHPTRTLRFVAFANEEPPYFWNEEMGSLVYAKACKARGVDIVAMISLESLGYYRDEPGSQKYPPVVRWLYPDRGDFVGFIGNLGSRTLVRDAIGTFRASTRFPSEGAALPSWVAGVGWSDHWSFWQVGYPAIMVTDTATFRNPHYHEPTDLPETLDYPRLARVTEGLVEVVAKLAR